MQISLDFPIELFHVNAVIDYFLMISQFADKLSGLDFALFRHRSQHQVWQVQYFYPPFFLFFLLQFCWIYKLKFIRVETFPNVPVTVISKKILTRLGDARKIINAFMKDTAVEKVVVLIFHNIQEKC